MYVKRGYGCKKSDVVKLEMKLIKSNLYHYISLALIGIWSVRDEGRTSEKV